MADDPKVSGGSKSPNAAQRAWLSELSKLMGGGGIDFGVAVKAKAAPGGAGAPPPGGPGSPAPAACVTPDATASDYFFDFNSSDLTASDKTYLAAYAKAYVGRKIAENIEVKGFASMEGDKPTNDKLSQSRADKVARYLIEQKVPKEKVNKPLGKGPTQHFSDSNLCLNRRVTITPVLELKVSDLVDVVEIEPQTIPPGPKPTLGEKAPQPDVPDPPEPCPTVSREWVEENLTEWLIALGQAQKLTPKDKDMVKSTERVYWAEQTLLGKVGDDGDTRMGPHGIRCGREDLEQGGITPIKGDERKYEAAVLAKTIMQNFPKRISQQNFDNFLKLKPVDAQEELSTVDHIRKKADNAANQVLSDLGVPKKYREKIKEFVKNKIPGGIDALPDVDDKTKEILKKAYKKLANIDDDEK